MDFALKKLLIKKIFSKEDKEKSILLGLVDLYIKTNAPIGSNFLKDSGFSHISSATIRNYFTELEKKEFLTQSHSSGGRIPTPKAFKFYAHFCQKNAQIEKKEDKLLKEALAKESKQITDYLNNSLDFLSNLTNLSVFQSSPRFDQDFINDIKIVALSPLKLLCVIITDFGLIKTEILYSKIPLDEKSIKLIEDFFLFRMQKKDDPLIDDHALLKQAKLLYNEIMVRYIVGYANYNTEDIYKTGLSQLLSYPEFNDPAVLAQCLSIFENSDQMNLILQSTIKNNELCFFIGDDLEKFGLKAQNMALICTPYYIANIAVGAIGILCPLRSPYKKLFGILKAYSRCLSDNLTKSIYKFKITYRKSSDYKTITQKSILLEDKSTGVK